MKYGRDTGSEVCGKDIFMLGCGSGTCSLGCGIDTCRNRRERKTANVGCMGVTCRVGIVCIFKVKFIINQT